ncbi:PKD-like family lipoprotein [Aestuariibaculum marinum]|uniref:PKD-like family protein n=1 Tax=Aestuariibaculum marinum TaxID=2683592 RepID=A0A8J6Q7G1_9FLAO|nr:PKD-like family lipoprotein [Aestuariibaculum marinum]MBD0824898.1 hypothetical protein [Aestuariibaculum marinum]
MLKYIKLKNLILLGMIIALFSCMEDEGNYDYREINEVAITGLEENYQYLQLDYFDIVPELSFTQGEQSNKFSYKWEALQRSQGTGGDRVFFISSEKNLTERVTLNPGAYDIYYTVKNLETNVETQYTCGLDVVTAVYEGWVMLTDNNSGPRLDMLSKLNDEYTPLYDVLEGSGLELTGEPGFVYTGPIVRGFYGIYVSTSGNGTVKLEPNNFSWNESYNIANEFVTNQPIDLEVDALGSSNSLWAYTIKDGNIYHYYGPWNKYYGVRVNHVNNEFFEASPWIVVERVWNYAVFYDNTNKRFVRNDQLYGMTTVMPNPPESSRKFDYTTGKDLKFMVSNNFGNTWNGTVFAVLNDPSDNKDYLAVFVNWNGQQRHYGEIVAPDFDKATSYAVSPNYGYLFYAVGSKVYQYDFTTQQTKTMIDKGSELISLIKFENYFSNKYSDLRNKLMVCSYDPSGQDGANGTLEFYDVPPVNEQIILEESYTGFGKIMSIAYRER